MYLKVKGPQGKESEARTFWKIQLTSQKHFLPDKLWTNFEFHQFILCHHSSDKIYAVDIYREGEMQKYSKCVWFAIILHLK